MDNKTFQTHDVRINIDLIDGPYFNLVFDLQINIFHPVSWGVHNNGKVINMLSTKKNPKNLSAISAQNYAKYIFNW